MTFRMLACKIVCLSLEVAVEVRLFVMRSKKEIRTKILRLLKLDISLVIGMSGKIFYSAGGTTRSYSRNSLCETNYICFPSPSWSSDDIRIKYRDETSREAAWTASRKAQAEAQKLREKEGIMVPYAIVERHPVYLHFNNLLKKETRRCMERARARNRMKRFVSDVHTVWLTNLQDLREHSFKHSFKVSWVSW